MLVAAWCTGLTVLALVLAKRHSGLRRGHGAVIVAANLTFIASPLVSVARSSVTLPRGVLLAGLITLAAAGIFALTLGVLLDVPDQIFSSDMHFAFLAVITVVTVTAKLNAAWLQGRTM
jgi:hypothetical protein